jgi:hypothetical protein
MTLHDGLTITGTEKIQICNYEIKDPYWTEKIFFLFWKLAPLPSIPPPAPRKQIDSDHLPFLTLSLSTGGGGEGGGQGGAKSNGTKAVFQIRDILVQIRIQGSLPLTNIEIRVFSSVTPTKNNFFLFFFQGTFT